MTDLAKWQCHKIVSAGKIDLVKLKEHALIVEMADGAPQVVCPGDDFWLRWKRGDDPNADQGYFVQYEDNYESWSPSETFEGGYTKING